MYVLPFSITLICLPANSTRSVCQVFNGAGALTYLMVFRLPFAV
jgi:hypothetical protein